MQVQTAVITVVGVGWGVFVGVLVEGVVAVSVGAGTIALVLLFDDGDLIVKKTPINTTMTATTA